jgi:hypothetical protein
MAVGIVGPLCCVDDRPTLDRDPPAIGGDVVGSHDASHGHRQMQDHDIARIPSPRDHGVALLEDDRLGVAVH